MVIGVPKEIQGLRIRVSVTPDGVRALDKPAIRCWIEPTAGQGSGFSDEAYRQAGAEIAQSKEDVFHRAELIVKVNRASIVRSARFFGRARCCLPICTWRRCRI